MATTSEYTTAQMIEHTPMGGWPDNPRPMRCIRCWKDIPAGSPSVEGRATSTGARHSWHVDCAPKRVLELAIDSTPAPRE